MQPTSTWEKNWYAISTLIRAKHSCRPYQREEYLYRRQCKKCKASIAFINCHFHCHRSKAQTQECQNNNNGKSNKNWVHQVRGSLFRKDFSRLFVDFEFGNSSYSLLVICLSCFLWSTSFPDKLHKLGFDRFSSFHEV